MVSVAVAKNADKKLSAAAAGREVWVSNTGGAEALRGLKKTFAGARRVVVVKSREDCCGVFSKYSPPASLGSDRWLGLLAARREFRRVVVVSAGTAVTIDALADGVFLGGVILPGLRLLAAGLRQFTKLPAVAGGGELPPAPPNNTRAALAAGGILAAGGAALEFRRKYLPGAPFLLTGGDGEKLLTVLPKAKVSPHLVLEGIAIFRGAREQ